ncbi:chalcone isomerase family protein [Shewanella sp. SR44-3]|uniref:chalcone isomerase family protein n=1 Tax=unclassified Shewanella TaxID=196818 RepID=UPI0015FA2410|nr:chalcone isomerase family protein [Shewanella sp. SR44-3]MBB1268355.1 chalcone isomerase family protein [Shewanella sp. SR44-3]
MIKKSLCLALALLCSSSAFADTKVGDVTLPDTLTVQEQVLQLNGAGIRSKFFMDLYVGSLFTLTKTDNAQAVVDSETPVVIQLNITSDMITSEKMTTAMNDGFKLATNGDTAPIASSISAFIAAFAEPIKTGDKFTLVSIPGQGIINYKNDKQLSVTEGEVFRKAVLSIWLGEDPTDEDLKEAMLDQ